MDKDFFTKFFFILWIFPSQIKAGYFRQIMMEMAM